MLSFTSCPGSRARATWRKAHQPAEPAPRSEFFPGKKCRGCRLSRQLSKVSANLPGIEAPRPRHLPGIEASRPRHLPGIGASHPAASKAHVPLVLSSITFLPGIGAAPPADVEASIPSAPLENISGTYVFEVGSFQCVPPPGRTTCPASLQDRSRGAGLAPRPKPRSRPCFRSPRLCHDLTGAIGQIISAKTYVNMFEGPVTGNIPEVLDNGEVTDGTHDTAGQLALALTAYAQVTDLAVNTAASGNGCHPVPGRQSTAELASKLDSSAGAAWPRRPGHHGRTGGRASPRCRPR